MENQRIGVETRSIDYVPLNERGGKVWHQGPFWFAGNFVPTTMLTGFIGPTLGLSALYSIISIVMGVMLGTFFMAFHANQGPTMGLPQMIQSRAQFGIRGVILPFLAVFFVYVGFNVFNVILAVDALEIVIPGYRSFWMLVIIAIAMIIAVIGHHLLHKIQRLITYMMISLFSVITIIAIKTIDMDLRITDTSFAFGVFLIQLSASAGYQISYSVYVSDYSRYLPEDTNSFQVIFWTYLGAGGSAIWLMSLGAYISSGVTTSDVIQIILSLGNKLFEGFGVIAILAIIPSLIGIMAVNSYGAMLTSISALDAFFPISPNRKIRVISLIFVSFIIYSVALLIPNDYLDSFNDFVLLMLYFLIPWTAVNLVDYYFVRQGNYVIPEIFNIKGIYGAWSKSGLIAYILSLISMIPFMSLSFYQGVFVGWMYGADLAFIPGLLVAGVSYYYLSRDIDLNKEKILKESFQGHLKGGGE